MFRDSVVRIFAFWVTADINKKCSRGNTSGQNDFLSHRCTDSILIAFLKIRHLEFLIFLEEFDRQNGKHKNSILIRTES